MPDTLPKLSKRDLARLRAVAASERTPHYAWADEQPSTTAYLVTVGALRRFDARTGAGELRQAVAVTPLGVRVLAGQPPAKSEPDALPKLTKTQLARLVEIGTAKRPPEPTEKPDTSAALIELGAAELFDRRPNAFVTVISMRLTPLGIRILAGLPGPEFEQFRALIARAETTEPTHADQL